jgi:hypothetical protein
MNRESSHQLFTALMAFMLVFFFLCMTVKTVVSAASTSNQGLGADYAFLAMTTISPDFSAAHYTIENENSSDVTLRIGRFPYAFTLMDRPQKSLKFEVSLAYQLTEQSIQTFPAAGEYIDSEWVTYGGDLGLLYEKALTENLHFTPSLRIGLVKMENRARYFGSQSLLLKPALDGDLLNWTTNAIVYQLSLGFKYGWKILDRQSRVRANAYRIMVESFNESSPSLSFTEPANMLEFDADVIFPTHINIAGDHLDLVLLLGMNNFVGENRDTLGFTSAYSVGIGGELPLLFKSKRYGHLRLSGSYLWADNMQGWMLTLGNNPN